jgi:hypothetical protein
VLISLQRTLFFLFGELFSKSFPNSSKILSLWNNLSVDKSVLALTAPQKTLLLRCYFFEGITIDKNYKSFGKGLENTS